MVRKHRSLKGRTLVSLALLAMLPGLALLPGQARAQAFPSKSVRMLIPFPPGGPADIIGRALANRMGPLLGQQVVVENRAGAGGMIAAEAVVKAGPDGYTIMTASAGALVIAQGITQVPYDTFRDLAPVTQAVSVPEVLVAIPRLGVSSMAQLIAYAKANPGKVSFASSGNAGIPHLAGELLKREAGIDIVHIPYKGAAPAVTDLLGGQVHIMFADIPVLLPQIQAGKLVPIALGSEQRAPTLPNVPTTAESGLPNVLANNWYGVLTTGGTPRDVVMRLNQSAVGALKSPELGELFAKQGARVVAGSPEEFTAFLRAETAKWATLAKNVGAKWD